MDSDGELILVVEDEAAMVRVMSVSLQARGYRVSVARTGQDGLDRSADEDPAVVILDLGLPDIDGVEVCRRLRREGRWAPVLILTARDGVADRVRGLDAGADDYLTKPFSFAELSARIRALIRRGGRQRPTELVVGELRLDPATRRAWRGAVELELTAKEFTLLEMFLRHPGEVLTRTRILENGWDFAYDAVSNVVDQYVGYLRRKIDRPFGLEQLETVRGAGYRLRVPTPAVTD